MSKFSIKPVLMVTHIVQTLWTRLGVWGHGVVYLVLMLPFSMMRHVRIHGDEKVYVGQALEMVRAGHLWQQLQFGDVNYIKGPLHYILLIVGHHLFGLSMLSTVYMNLVFGALAVVSLRAATPKLIPESKSLWAFPGVVFASSGAFVLFSFSSQMDSLLTSLYAIVLSLAVLARHSNKTLLFALMWLSVGLAGALKSPLHSVLLGISVLAFFAVMSAFSSQLFSSIGRWKCLFAGVLLCGAGYLLPWLFDEVRWLETYIRREQVDRPRFVDSGVLFLLNNFVFHVFPWSVLVVQALWMAGRRHWRGEYRLTELEKVSLAFMLPTFLFFFGLGYRAAWYGLPLLAPLSLWVIGQFRTVSHPLRFFASRMIPCGAVLLLALMLCHFSFQGMTPWWNWTTTIVLGSTFVAAMFVFEAVSSARIQHAARGLCVGVALFWTASLGMTAVLGEAELYDVREALEHHSAPLNYSNLTRENYSEWGYMAYMTGKPSYFSTSPDELFAAGKQGQWLVFTKGEELESFWSWMKSTHRLSSLDANPSVLTWRRWPRNGKQLMELWSQRTDVEDVWNKSSRHYFLVKFNSSVSRNVSAPGLE